LHRAADGAILRHTVLRLIWSAPFFDWGWGFLLLQSRLLGRESMNSVTLIRVVAGVLAAVVLVILMFRMKKKAPR
jgi:hypothetical protein